MVKSVVQAMVELAVRAHSSRDRNNSRVQGELLVAVPKVVVVVAQVVIIGVFTPVEVDVTV